MECFFWNLGANKIILWKQMTITFLQFYYPLCGYVDNPQVFLFTSWESMSTQQLKIMSSVVTAAVSCQM